MNFQFNENNNETPSVNMAGSKKLIFISYSVANNDKIKIIQKVLKDHPRFESLIVVQDEMPLTPLEKKVIEGIHRASYIVPVLTKLSYREQWINQEIGFARASDKSIVPIVEYEITGELKGFIHNQAHLPYCYNSNGNIAQENKQFKKVFEKLILELEGEGVFPEIEVPQQQTRKQKLQEIQRRDKYEYERRTFAASSSAFYKAHEEVDALMELLKEEKKDAVGEGLKVKGEESLPTIQCKYYIIKSKSHSISIKWCPKDEGNIVDTFLLVSFCEGHKTMQGKFPDDLPTRMCTEYTYEYDLKMDGSAGWKRTQDNRYFTNEEIAKECIDYLVDNA